MPVRRLLPLAMAALLAVAAALYLAGIGAGGAGSGSGVAALMIDREAPLFSLPPVEGRSQGLATPDLKGRASLVNVFASWCVPCRAEHPMLMRLAREGVPVYGINIKDKPADMKAFLDELGNPFARIGADSDGRASLAWGVYGYPESFVVDAQGRIRYKQPGPITPADLQDRILPILRSLGA
jgi:cytochrome c biogenesis protein CcmG, thiol:disulfide interchange protein DsbE